MGNLKTCLGDISSVLITKAWISSNIYLFGILNKYHTGYLDDAGPFIKKNKIWGHTCDFSWEGMNKYLFIWDREPGQAKENIPSKSRSVEQISLFRSFIELEVAYRSMHDLKVATSPKCPPPAQVMLHENSTPGALSTALLCHSESSLLCNHHCFYNPTEKPCESS